MVSFRIFFKLFVRVLWITGALGFFHNFSSSASRTESVIEERHNLFMLATLSYLYNHRASDVGGPIVSLLAWDIENIQTTPRFIIDRNRNRQKNSPLHHAEVTTLHSAFSLKPDHVRNHEWLEKTVLYSSLESCPMCASTIIMAHVPRVIHCVDDPDVRRTPTERTIPTVREFNGRALALDKSTLPICQQLNDQLWRAHDAQPTPFRATKFLYNDLDLGEPGLHAQAAKQFLNYKPANEENNDLHQKLLEAIGP
jgi:tRNA(Arg) A34 adenosine deaminase TadA